MVHIKKVEIFGFKSFGFKNTTVQFEPGLVSISGPNGSGKSNILDAIIFALGENKPKMMRVDKLRSLLHDIEGNRHGPKIARSSVHFDNTDRKIPIDSDIVEITREMDDKGENNYYLNKKPTNRGQILDLLDVANAGLGQLNAVQQGTVTRISEFSSEEKRKTIEELIGLSYFDEKKTEAVKQLDDADRRLEIALAKMGEIKKRIDELEEERNQKLRHDIIERELNKYKGIAAVNKLKVVLNQKSTKEDSLKNLDSEIQKISDERRILRDEISMLENKKTKLMQAANEYSQAKSTIDLELSSAMEQYEIDNTSIVASKKRIEQISSRIPEINMDLEVIKNNISEINSKINQAENQIQEINLQKKKINQDLQEIDFDRTKILKEQSIAASKKSEIDNKLKSLSANLNEIKLKLSQEESSKEESIKKIKTNSDKLSKLEQDLVSLSNLKTRLETVIQNHNSTISELKNRRLGLDSKKSKFIDDLNDLELILEKSSKAANQYDTKIKTVKTMLHEDYTIARLKEDVLKMGIDGLVYELISWDKKYERSILAASSDWLKAFVVKDFETLVKIVDLARSKNLPKLKIIPLEAIPKLHLKVPKESGILGVLSDFVNCNSVHNPLKSFLFGNVVLTNSRDSAQKISNLGYKAVTTDGEYFEAKGGAVVVDINTKISKLTKIISMSSDIEGLLESINLLKKYVLKKKNSVKKIEEAIQSNSARLSLSEKSIASAEENYANLKSRIDSILNTKQQLLNRISELEKRKIHQIQDISVHESHIESLNQRISIVDTHYAGGEDSRISNEISRINVKKSEIESLYTSITNEYRDHSSLLTELQTTEAREKSKAKNLENEILSLNQQNEELENKIKGLEKNRESKTEILVKLREKEQQLISTSGSSIGQIQEFDQNLKILSEQDKDLTKKINLLERQTDSLNRDLKELVENETQLNNQISSFGFNENIETFNVDPIIHGLTVELTSLNSLNAKAPETYLEVSSGYRSMSTRKNSLEEERNSIVKFIEDIEKDKRQTFLDAFDKVDKEIRLIFGNMTGGNAWLELQNEDDIFNSGISYLIQFPNKPKRESTSISGGEKTLAAIVFVLALQKLKPSPFYLFDEVDAHLDAPNSERLAKILEERSQESQFIMVSLKDSVVQKAKLIYGVYPKNGVSYVVTYKDKRMPTVKTN